MQTVHHFSELDGGSTGDMSVFNAPLDLSSPAVPPPSPTPQSGDGTHIPQRVKRLEDEVSALKVKVDNERQDFVLDDLRESGFFSFGILYAFIVELEEKRMTDENMLHVVSALF